MRGAVRKIQAAEAAHVACEHLYFTATTGHVFAATTVRFRKLKLPWYGIVSVSIDGTPLEVVADGVRFSGQVLAIHARDVHFLANNVHYVSAVANPLHDQFRAFTRLMPPVRVLDEKPFARFRSFGERAIAGALEPEEAHNLFDGLHSAAKAFLPPNQPRDDRARIVVDELWKNPNATLDSLALRLGLSYHRTSHLCADALGITVRAYQLWQKLYRTNFPLLSGASLTETAYAANFVDSAHYSRIFQKSYGRAPSDMFRTCGVKIHSTRAVCEARAELIPPKST